MKRNKARHIDYNLRFVAALESDEPMMVCILMREIITEALKAFRAQRTTKDAWLQLEIVNQLLRQSFLGQDAPPLFDMYGKLGGHLCRIGYLETGAACVKLFSKYGYRPMSEWPLAKAREKSEVKSLANLAEDMEEISAADLDRCTLPEISPVQLF